MTGDAPVASSNRRARQVVSLLRLAALALLVVGFSGWLFADEVVLESPFTLAFGAGVVCALASIYLGIFLANRD